MSLFDDKSDLEVLADMVSCYGYGDGKNSDEWPKIKKLRMVLDIAICKSDVTADRRWCPRCGSNLMLCGGTTCCEDCDFQVQRSLM